VSLVLGDEYEHVKANLKEKNREYFNSEKMSSVDLMSRGKQYHRYMIFSGIE
jgi:hypothetical protein